MLFLMKKKIIRLKMEAKYFKNISIYASFNLNDVYVDVKCHVKVKYNYTSKKCMWEKAGKENKIYFAC